METKEILEIFKNERSVIPRPVALPIDGTRSKFEADDRNIGGYPIVWGEINDYREMPIKGCTLKSLNARGVGATKNPILVLNQHRTSEILCRPTVLREDDYGLYFEGEVIQGTEYADIALAQIRQGVLKQLSYGFDYIYDMVEYDEGTDAFILKEIKLWEISPVTWSSGESAQLRSFRDHQMQAIINKYTREQISDLTNLLALRTATSTQEEKEDEFTKSLKLF